LYKYESKRRSSIRRHALICPTRGRPHRLKEFIESALTTATHPERVDIELYIDDDDQKITQYETVISNLRKNFSNSLISSTLGPSIGVPRAANLLFYQSTADIFMTSNDDQVFIDHGWDTRLDIEIEKYQDDIFCIWFNDNWESQNFCTFPIISRKWVETLGYFQFPFFEHYFVDAWIWMLAKAIDRDNYIHEIIVEHRHWKTGKSQKDATYNMHRTNENVSKYARDRSVIDKFERYFHADVEALKNVMV